MHKLTTGNVETFKYFANYHKPEYVAVKKFSGNGANNSRYQRRKYAEEVFQAWFLHQDKYGVENLFMLQVTGPLTIDCDSKSDLIDELKDLGVSDDDILHLKKMSVKKIIALTMTDASEDSRVVETEEHTDRVRWDFKVGLKAIKVTPDLETRTQLKAKIEIDYQYEVEALYGEVKIGLPEGTVLVEDCMLEVTNCSR
jgi:hypothetical protein